MEICKAAEKILKSRLGFNHPGGAYQNSSQQLLVDLSNAVLGELLERFESKLTRLDSTNPLDSQKQIYLKEVERVAKENYTLKFVVS
jgi:hypothetical protein